MTDFNETEYLSLYPDVAAAVKAGAFTSGYAHYVKYGLAEGRAGNFNKFRPMHTEIGKPETKRSTLAAHSNLWNWIGQNFNKKELKVLEIGSRAVVSDSLWNRVIPNVSYTGFDVLPGKNVDVVGDAHRLSQYFPNQKFDLIISLLYWSIWQCLGLSLKKSPSF